MFQRGGFKPFFVGSTATIGRDLVFGGFFALFRHELFSRTKSSSAGSSSSKQPGDKFLVNLFAASAATILSSPLNYVRNIHYATPPDVKPDTFWKIFSDLVCNALREPTLLQKLSYIQSRYRIGWGTARVGCGMAFGSYIYNQCAQTEIYTSK